MTADEFMRLKEHVDAMWGNNSKWSNPKAAFAGSSRIRKTPFTAAWQAVESLMAANRSYAPSIVEVVNAAAQFTPGGGFDPGECRHPRFGVLSYVGGFPKSGICALCRVEVDDLSVFGVKVGDE